MAIAADTESNASSPVVVPDIDLVKKQSAHDTGAGSLFMRTGSLFMRVGEFVILSVLAILFVEGIFRLCGIGQQEYLQTDPVLGCRHISNQLVTWRMEGYSSDRLSSAGLRDTEHSIAKPAGIKRIALLGDSSTEGLQVPLSNTYAKILERGLNKQSPQYEVINFACSSYSTGQEYLQFKKEAEQYKPDVTVVLYNCGDTQENVRDPNKVDVEPRPYFYLNNRGSLCEDDLLLKKIRKSLPQSSQTASGGNKLTPYSNDLNNFLQRNSRIYDVLKQTDLMLSINEKLYRKLRTSICSMVAATTGTAKAAQCYKAQYPKPDSLLVSEQLLLALNAECKRVNSKFIVALFPNTNNNALYAAEQKNLHAFAAKNKLEMLDLTSAFLSAGKPGELFLQYHFSSCGHKLVADQLAAMIKQ